MSSRLTRIVLVTVAYLVLTVIMSWPVAAHLASVRMGGGADPSLYVWTIGWGTYALTHAPWAVFDANIFFPYHHTLAYSENLLGSALLALPVIWVGGDALAATNAVALLSVLLCALGAYFLGRTLGLSPTAAFLCGLIFAFAPPRFARLPQLHLTAVQWVPFGLAFLHRYLAHGRARDLRWTLALLSLQALTSGHGAALFLLAAAIIMAFHLAWGQPVNLRGRLRDIGVVGTLALVPAALAFIPYWLARRDVPLDRVLDDVGVSWSSYVSSPAHIQQWLLAQLPRWDWLVAEPDVFLFPGLVTLVLAGLALTRRVSRDRWIYLTVALVTVWLTVGPPLSLWRWIYWFPGLNFIRVPSRFTIVGMLALAVLAGLGFDRLTKRWPRVRTHLAAGAIATLCLAEFAMMPVDARPFTLDTPAIDAWLNTQPKPFSVAEVPVSSSSADSRRAEVATMYMLHSLAHHQPTVFGFSGAEPETYKPLYNDLIAFPSDDSIAHLTELGVTYVVVHLEYFTDEARRDYEAQLAAFADQLQFVHQEGPGRVYRLVTNDRPAPPSSE